MTSFAEPDIIACPHCEQRYLRHVLRSLNFNWQKTYSDGATYGMLSNIMVRESCCTSCGNIIKNIPDLPRLGPNTAPSRWQRWFTTPQTYAYLPAASFDLYLELFDHEADIDMKRHWAIKALRLFNINHKLDENKPAPEAEKQSAYLNIADFILDNPDTAHLDEYALNCADIHRLRGDFSLAKQVYDTVIDKEYADIVEQGKGWCDDKNTRLMLTHIPEIDD